MEKGIEVLGYWVVRKELIGQNNVCRDKRGLGIRNYVQLWTMGYGPWAMVHDFIDDK